MNLFFSLWTLFPFLDVAFGPSFSSDVDASTFDPVTKGILIAVLVLFLAFVGYLIWKSIKDKRDDN